VIGSCMYNLYNAVEGGATEALVEHGVVAVS
jgi:hypothetical protein